VADTPNLGAVVDPADRLQLGVFRNTRDGHVCEVPGANAGRSGAIFLLHAGARGTQIGVMAEPEDFHGDFLPRFIEFKEISRFATPDLGYCCSSSGMKAALPAATTPS
jgi:hypothetical protein